MSNSTRGTALVAAICALMCANASAATTYVVGKTADDAGSDPCTVAANCSLRSAITDANNNAGADTIALGAATYSVGSPEPPITDALTISGAGARSTAIDGGGTSQGLLDVNTSKAVAISDLAVQHAAQGNVTGAALFVETAAPLSLTRVAMVDNSSMALFENGGVVQILDSLVARNTAQAIGGLANSSDQSLMLISNSTIANNTALAAAASGPIAVVGGFSNRGATTIVDSTIAGNRIAGGAIAIGGDNIISQASTGTSLGILRLINTIVADASPNGNCSGTIQSGGHNLDSDGTCGLGAGTDQSNIDPLLAPLANNGGPTDTRALTANSPAVDAGAGCAATDQRGVARPAGGACDIGAFESPFTAPGPVVTPPVTPPTNTPAADTTPPVLTVSGIGKTVKRKTFNKGLKVKVGANEPITADLILLAQPRKVTIAKVPSVALATTTLSRGGGTRTVTLKPSTKVRGTRKVKMQLRVIAYDAAGNRSAKTVSFTVK
jgi:hypothetical protein